MHPHWIGSRRYILPLLLLCALALVLSALALSASAQTNPPISGNWDIYDDTTVSNRQVTIQGSVIVHGGGKLTLSSVDLLVTPSSEGGASLTVQGSGRLIWNKGSLGSANKNHYQFIAQSASSVTLDGVTVSGMWQDRTGGLATNPDVADHARGIRGGMQIYSSTVTVANCTFTTNDRVAMTIVSASPVIRNTAFYKSAYFSYCPYSYAYLYRDAYGIISIDGNPRIEGCTFVEMGDYSTAFNDVNQNGYYYTYLSLEGHGIYASKGAPQVLDCTFSDTGRTPSSSYYYVYVDGRYIYFYFYQTNLRGCVRAYEPLMLTVRGCNFTDNYIGYQDTYNPTDAAYSIVIEGGKANVWDCIALRNGGGLLFSSASDLTFKDCAAYDFNEYGLVLRGGGSQSVHDVILNGTLDERNRVDEVGVMFYEASAVFDVHDINISFVFYGIDAESTALARIRDTTVSNTTRKVYAQNARIDCYNVTALPTECELGYYQSEINLYFKLELLVTWQNGLRIPMAVVQVFNDTDGLLLAVQSGSDGRVAPLTMLQTKMSGTNTARTTTNNDPIKISAFANGTSSDVYTIPFQNNTYFHLIVWDRSPPSVVIYTPKDDHAQNTTRLDIRGVAFDFGSGLLGVEVSIDGQSWERTHGLLWNLTLELEEGVYDLQVKGMDIGGGSSITIIKNVTIDLTAPWLHITQPKQTAGTIFTNSTSITISGQAEIGSDVFVNGVVLPLVGGQFYTQRSFSSEGMNTYEVMAVDKVGNRNITILYVYQDITDPVLIIEHPDEQYITNERVLQVSGLTDPEVAITINGIDVPVEGGLFTLAMTLEQGTNIIVVEAVDLAQNHRSTTLRVVYDTEPPKLTMTFPSRDVAVNSSNVVVSGSVDADVSTVRVNHVLVPVVNNRFSKNFKLDEGANLIIIDVVDRAGNAVSRSYAVMLDTDAPDLVVTSPLDRSYTTTRSVVLTGRVEVGALVTVNGASVNSSGGYLRVPLMLDETPPGGAPNVIAVVAMDAVGNTASVTLHIVADTQAPRLVLYDTPPSVRTDFFNLSGTVSDPFDLSELSVNGAPVEPNGDGFFEAFAGLSLGNNTLTVRAVDRAGNVAMQSITIDRLSIKVQDEGLMGLGDWSWLLLLLFLGVGLTVAFGAMWVLSRKEARA